MPCHGFCCWGGGTAEGRVALRLIVSHQRASQPDIEVLAVGSPRVPAGEIHRAVVVCVASNPTAPWWHDLQLRLGSFLHPVSDSARARARAQYGVSSKISGGTSCRIAPALIGRAVPVLVDTACRALSTSTSRFAAQIWVCSPPQRWVDVSTYPGTGWLAGRECKSSSPRGTRLCSVGIYPIQIGRKPRI